MRDVRDAAPSPGANEEVRAAQVRAVLQGLDRLQAKVFFQKPLTSSDTSGQGRVVIPKAIAEHYFPRLEQQQGILIGAIDTEGRQYKFKYRFWVNNHVSRMYLIEGAADLHRAYAMSVGDVMMFAQREDGTLVVAGRPATKADVVKKTPVKRPSSRYEGAAAAAVAAAAAAGCSSSAAKRRALQAAPWGDGVFRVLPHGSGPQVAGVSCRQEEEEDRAEWRVTLSLQGEVYQAVFDCREDAEEAYLASGACPLLPPPPTLRRM